MSANVVEWLSIAIFFICLFAFSLAEGGVINKIGQVPFGKAFAYAFATNTLAITIGFFVSFVIFVVLLMLAFDGTLQGLSGNDWRLISAVVVGFAFPFLLLIMAKRLALRIFKMPGVTRPWVFSIAASVVFLLSVTAVPVAFLYVAL